MQRDRRAGRASGGAEKERPLEAGGVDGEAPIGLDRGGFAGAAAVEQGDRAGDGAPAAAVPEMALALTLAEDCVLFAVVLPLDPPPPPQAVRARAVAMRLARVLILDFMMSSAFCPVTLIHDH